MDGFAPLQGQIDDGRGKEGSGNLAIFFDDIDIMDLIGPSPEVDGHMPNAAAIVGGSVQLAVHVGLST
jgi:hypothetical protein